MVEERLEPWHLTASPAFHPRLSLLAFDWESVHQMNSLNNKMLHHNSKLQEGRKSDNIFLWGLLLPAPEWWLFYNTGVANPPVQWFVSSLVQKAPRTDRGQVRKRMSE